MQPLYRGISYVFYPGSMAVLGLGFTHFKDPVSAWVWIIFISGMVILPLMALFLYMRLGRVSDIFIYQREQRHGLYVLGVIFSAVTSWLIFRENVLPVMVWSICNMSVLTLLFIINFAGYKVSAHMAGAAGLLGWIISLQSSGLPVFAAIVLTMLVYIARNLLQFYMKKRAMQPILPLIDLMFSTHLMMIRAISFKMR